MTRGRNLRGGGDAGRRESWVTLLGRRARRDPKRVAYIFLDESGEESRRMTYGELDRKVRAIASVIGRSGDRRRPALLLYPPGLDFVVGFLACLYAGVPAVPAYPPRGKRGLPRLLSILADCRPGLLLSQSAMARSLERWDLDDLAAGSQILLTDTVKAEGADLEQPPAVAADDLAFLQYTSGSTGEPRGVMVSHGNLLRNEEVIRRTFAQSRDSVILSWLPLYHDMGLIGGALQPLYVGARCILMSPMTFLRRPRIWLEAISRYRATTSGGPQLRLRAVLAARSSRRA